MSQRKPDLKAFLRSMNLQLSRYMLSRVGSKRHELRFVTRPDRPYRISSGTEIYLENSHSPAQVDYSWVYRSIGFGDLGVLCCSGTRPSLREITIRAVVEEASPIQFGPKHTIRAGFEGEDEQFGEGTEYCCRLDFAKPRDDAEQSSELLVMGLGIVHYPFWARGSAMYHVETAKKHAETIGNESVLSKKEKKQVETDFEYLAKTMSVDVIMVLDSGELLAFHWDQEEQEFADNFYNVGLVAS